jgi:hypothetical protein
MAKIEEIDALPGNSNSSKVAPLRERKKRREEHEPAQIMKSRREPVVARAVRRKKTFSQSIASAIAGEETRNVGSYIFQEVLIPAAKNLLQEMVTSGIEMILYGETSGRNRNKDKGRSVISYSSYYKDRDRDDRREPKRRKVRDRFDLSDIYFRDGDEADDVLRELQDRLEQYEEVTVAEFFDLAQLEGATWAHNNYGWRDLDRAKITHTRNGYLILFPDPEELE